MDALTLVNFGTVPLVHLHEPATGSSFRKDI